MAKTLYWNHLSAMETRLESVRCIECNDTASFYESEQVDEELTELLARIAQLEKQCETNCDLLREAYAETAKVKSDTEAACKRLTADNQRLTSQNQRLRADAERLNWLSDNALIDDDHGGCYQFEWYGDLRSAIDAARGGK